MNRNTYLEAPFQVVLELQTTNSNYFKKTYSLIKLFLLINSAQITYINFTKI